MRSPGSPSRKQTDQSLCRRTSPPFHKLPRFAPPSSPCSPSLLACTTSGDTADAPTQTTKKQYVPLSPPDIYPSHPQPFFFQSQYLRLRSHGHRGSLTLLSCFLALPLAALLWAILSFTIGIGAFCFTSVAGADVHTRTLLGGVLGVLLTLAVLTLLVFWDAWRSPPTSEPEDHARGVGIRKKLVHEGWIRHTRRRMKIVHTGAMDGIQTRMKKVRIVVGRVFSMGRRMRRTAPESSDVRSAKEGSGVTMDTVDHTDV
jgi:hypothetical protein